MKNFPSTYKYTLPKFWIDKVKFYNEFANGGMQVTIKIKNGIMYQQVLISNCMHIIAIKGYKDLPFTLDDIADIFQTEEDKKLTKKEFNEQGGWYYWDWDGRTNA